MHQQLSASIGRFFEKLPKITKDYGLSVLFYTAWISITWISRQDFTLTNFNDHVISSATLNQLDADKRILTALKFFPLLTFLITALLFFFYKVDAIFSTSSKSIIQTSSGLGILLFFTHLFISQDFPHPFFYVIFFTQFLCVLSAICFHKWKKHEYLTTPVYTSWLLLISFASTAFVLGTKKIADFFSFFDGSNKSLFIFIVFQSVFFLTSFAWRSFACRHEKDGTASFRALIFSTAPILLIGLLPFISNEAYLIANHHKVYSLTPDRLSMLGTIILSSASIFAYLRNNSWKLTVERLLSAYYFPVFIICVGALLWYTPTVTASPDMFEPANSALMIQQFFEFGKIPFIETFNAHAFSDAFWGLLYSTINGYSSTGWTQYDFFQRIAELLLIYFFLKKITRNQYFSIGIVLFVPQLSVLFPPIYTMALAVLGAFYYVFQSRRLLPYLAFAFLLELMMLFRIDIGTSAIISTLVTLFVSASFSLLKNTRVRWKELTIASSIAAATTGLALVALLEIRNIPILPWIKDILHILNSNQSFAYPELWVDLDKYAVWNYFVVPILLTIATYILIVLIYLRRLLDYKVVLLSYFFLVAFTLSNLALRGVIRHNLFENTALIISTFSTLLISGMLYFSLKKHGAYAQFMVFSISALMIIHQFILVPNDPQTPAIRKDTGLLSETFTQLNNLPEIHPQKHLINRGTIPKRISESSFDEFSKFIKSELDDKETFFDFSNSPMLYVYTHKATPFFTNHLMLTHDDYLQKRALENLKDYDIPVLVFSNIQPYNLDYVPFQLRYYRLTEYFYNNYHPYAIMNGREIWLRNDWKPRTGSYQASSPIHSSALPQDFQTKYLPYVWGTYDSESLKHLSVKRDFSAFTNTPTRESSADSMRYEFKPLSHEEKMTGGTYILLELQLNTNAKTGDQKITLSYGEDSQAAGSVQFLAINDGKVHQYAIRISTLYSWKKTSSSWIILQSPASSTLETKNISIVQGD